MPRWRRRARNEFPSIDPARVGQIDACYIYEDERLQTVSFRIPLEEDSDPRVLEELRKKAAAAAAGGALEYDIP